MPRIAAEKKEARRESIVLAARSVFLAKGYASAAVSDIAQAAGVSDGLLYRYFSGKRELLMEVLEVFYPTLPDQTLDGGQRVEGLSLGASGNITSNWTISANYMYLKSKILQGVSDFCLANPGTGLNTTTLTGGCGNNAAFPDPTKGYSLTNTPKHSGSLFTTYRFGFGLELGYGLTHQGSFLLNQPTLAQRVANSYVGYRVPSYTIHRFMASYPISDRLKAQLNVQNFTNEKYVTTVRNSLNGSWAQPAATRSAVLSLNYQL